MHRPQNVDPWDPTWLYSKFEWRSANDPDHPGVFYYCQVAYDAATYNDAMAAGPADDTDPMVSGCGNFAWSVLCPGSDGCPPKYSAV